MSEINAGELILELRAETSAFLNDIRAAGKQAADQISSDLRNALNSATAQQNQLNQSVQRGVQSRQEELDLYGQLRKADIERYQAQLRLNEAEFQRIQAAGGYSADLAKEIRTRKEILSNLERELEVHESNLRAQRELSRFQGANVQAARSLINLGNSEIANLNEKSKLTKAATEYESKRNAVLERSAKLYKQIEEALSKSAQHSQKIKNDTNVDILKAQSSRAQSSNVLGGGLIGKAEANKDAGIKLENLQLAQQLTQEEAKYKATVKEINQAHRERIGILQQLNTPQAEITEAGRKHVELTKQLKSEYQSLRSNLNSLSQERIKNIDAEFNKAKSESSQLKFLFREIGEGFANTIGSGLTSLVTSLITTPVNLAIGLLRSAVTGIIGQITSSLDAFKQYERVTATTNIATQGQGAQAVPFLNQVSEKYKYPVLELAASYNQLAASMLGAGKTLDETNFVYERLVLSGRALSMSTQDIEGIVTAVSQSFSKGKVQAEELRGQLGDRFPGAVTLMAQALGVTTAELDKMMQQGQLTSDVFFAFVRGVEEKYGAKLPGALKTTASAADDLKNRIFNLQKDFGESINPINQAALEAASQILERISRGAFTQIRQRAEEIRNYLQQNPQIVENISSRINTLLSQGLRQVADKAKELLEYLSRNPGAIDEGLNRLTQMAEVFGKLVGYAGQFAQWIVSAAENMDRLMAIPGVKEFLFGAPTIDLNKGAFGMDNGIKSSPTGETSSESYVTGTIAGQQYGDSRSGGGRRHAGVDFDISGPNAKAVTFAGGIVSHIGHDPGGYGHWVDVYNPQTKMTERIAEAAEVIVKVGQRLAPGQVVGRGESETGVIHFEVRTDGQLRGPAGSGFNGSINPLDYLRNNNLATVSSSGGQTTITPRAIAGPAPVGNSSSPGGSSTSSGKPREGMGTITNLSGSKTAPPVNIQQGRNANAYLSRLAFLESTFNTSAYNRSSGAAGAFQFTPATVSDALKEGIADPTKGDLNAQAAATLAFIKKFHPEAYQAILKGDWATADRLLKGRWSALPGGGEGQSGERMRQANAYLTGSTPKVSVNASPNEAEQAPGTSAEELANRQQSEFKSYQDQTKKANREAEDARTQTARADRDAAVERAKAFVGQSDSATKFFQRVSEITKLNDQQEDATKEGRRAISDKEAELKELREKPLQFNENQTERNKAIKALETLIATLRTQVGAIEKQFAQQIEAKNVEYQRAFEKGKRDLEAERRQFDLASGNESRQAQNELARSSLDLNQFDSQRLQVQQDNEAIDADTETKKAPLQKALDETKTELKNFEEAITKLPQALQEQARKDPGYQLLKDRVQLAQDRVDQVDANTFTRRRINENRMMKIDRDQARATQQATQSADDEVTPLTESNYRSSLEATNMNPLDITARVNELSRSNAAAKINRDLEQNIETLRENGTLTAELEDRLRAVAAIKIDNLRFQFKDLATLIRDELAGQFKTLFDSLDGSFKSFFTDLISGTKSIGDSFKQLFSSILSQLAQLAVNRLWTQLLGGKGVGGLFQTQSEPGFGGGLLGLGTSLLGAFTGGGAGGLAGAFTGASNFGFASGVSIPALAQGGIVQGRLGGGLAILGDNTSGSEAVVPLPGAGRGIPVEFKGSRMGLNSVSKVEVTVNNNGQSTISSNAGGQLGRQLEQAVRGVLVKEMRPKGLLNP